MQYIFINPYLARSKSKFFFWGVNVLSIESMTPSDHRSLFCYEVIVVKYHIMGTFQICPPYLSFLPSLISFSFLLLLSLYSSHLFRLLPFPLSSRGTTMTVDTTTYLFSVQLFFPANHRSDTHRLIYYCSCYFSLLAIMSNG